MAQLQAQADALAAQVQFHLATTLTALMLHITSAFLLHPCKPAFPCMDLSCNIRQLALAVHLRENSVSFPAA